VRRKKALVAFALLVVRFLIYEAARDTPDHDADNVQSARSNEDAKPAHAMGLFEVHV
jgi:hypothetical protein